MTYIYELNFLLILHFPYDLHFLYHYISLSVHVYWIWLKLKREQGFTLAGFKSIRGETGKYIKIFYFTSGVVLFYLNLEISLYSNTCDNTKLHSLVQIQQQKQQKKVWNMFKVNNKTTRTMSLTL